MMLAATRAGTADALVAEMKVSQPVPLKWLTTQMPRMHSKAYRWVAEMEEITAFVGEDQPGFGFYETAARLYEQIAADFSGSRQETAVLDAFCDKAKRRWPAFDASGTTAKRTRVDRVTGRHITSPALARSR